MLADLAADAYDDALPIVPLLVDRWHSPIERHGYRATTGSRCFGGFGTIAACALVAAGLFVTLNRFDRPKPVSPATRLTVLSVASPQPTKPTKAEKPKALPKPVVEPVARTMPTVRPIVPTRPLPALPTAVAQVTPVVPAERPSPPAPPQPAPPTPAAPTPAAHGPDKWEGRVLARIERFRRYPADAEHAHVQGTATVRFRIDRDGHVLSSSLDHSSGSAALDAAALDTLRRADPLPKIPVDRPDEVELVVPIEFSMKR